MIHFSRIEPKDAVDIVLPRAGIQGPLDDEGNECPWPWDPIQLKGAPLGQYHCPYCGAMVMAGMDHLDSRGMDEAYAQYCKEEQEREARG